MKSICSILLSMAAVCVAWASMVRGATAREPAATAVVELTVRGPQGQPLGRTEVTVANRQFPDMDRLPATHATSDDHGVIRFSWPVGVKRGLVTAGNVGYGATGWFEVAEGRTAQPLLPPLIPFGALGGTVPPEAMKPGTYLELPGDTPDEKTKALCDGRGHFAFEHVRCGGYWLRPRSDREFSDWGTSVFVAPGQRLTGIQFHKIENRSRTPAAGSRPVARREEHSNLWAAGTVHDEAGHTVVGAAVYAIVHYFGGMRMYEDVQFAKTDEQGHWTIRGEPRWSMFTGTLVAHKAGHPFAAIPMRNPGLTQIEALAIR